MTLKHYLKRFHNIAWYPSCGRDALPALALSKRSFFEIDLPVEDAPDCFLYTDYDSRVNCQENRRYFLELERGQFTAAFAEPVRSNFRCTATAFNIEELNPIKIGFDPEMVDFGKDENYGRVFVFDLLVENPKFGQSIAKLIYVIAENTAFAFDFLLENGIKVKHVIQSNYGHGFGGGRSNGLFLPHIFEALGVQYFASDIEEGNADSDLAERYLSESQKKRIPILKRLIDLHAYANLYGYGPTILYKVEGFEEAVKTIWNQNPHCYINNR